MKKFAVLLFALVSIAACKKQEETHYYNANDISFVASTANPKTFIAVANSKGGQDTFTLNTGGAQYMFSSKQTGNTLVITSGNLITPDTINLYDTSVLTLNFYNKDQLIGTRQEYLVPGAMATTLFTLE